MKKFFALCFMAVIVLALGSCACASNRYNPEDWRDIEDERISSIWNNENYSQEYKQQNGYYGNNCKEFVRYVCSSENRRNLPSTNDDGRTLGQLTHIDGGQWLNNVHGDERADRGPTSAEVKAVFANAVSGDVVQMRWKNGYITMHTALINDIDENGVTFFQSHIETNSNNECGYQCSSNYYDWEELSGFYSYSNTAGGLSIYSFHNTAERRPVLPEGSVRIDAENFPDENFRSYVLENCDPNKDGILSAEEAASVTHISIDYRGVADLKGIEYFTALTYLSCSGNQLTALDVSNKAALTWLFCYDNQLTALDLSNNTALIDLDCRQNQLTALDLSKNTALSELHCSGNQLTALDLSKNTALTTLWCGGNQLTALDLSKNTALTTLWCDGNQLTAIDVSKNTALMYLHCESNQLTTLDVSGCTALRELHCANNQLTALDMSKNIALTHLYCYNNQLTALDMSKNTKLYDLWCSNNQLTELNVSGCTDLTILYCESNQLTELDVSNCPDDIYIGCDSGVRILRNKPTLISSLVDITTNTPVSVFRLRSNVLDATAQLIEAVVKSGIITDTGTKETLNKVAKGLQIISSIYSGDFFKRFFTNILIPSILKSSGDDGDTEKFQLSESLSLNVTPGVFKTSEGTVKITLASSRDLSNDVYCMIASGDSGRFFKVPASAGSRRVFTAEFNAGELFASLDAGMIDIMCVSCVSDDEGICGMLMSNTAFVDWLKKDNTPPENLPDTLGIAITGQPYTLQLTATGGDTIIWTRTGSFPTGLTLNSDGLISGTPKKAGNFTFTVTAKNKYGTYSKKYTVKVIDPVSITTASLKAGIIDKSYTVTMMAKGTKPITWSAEGLPAGLTMNAKTGKISGKPTAYGDFSVKITAENEAGSVTRTLALTVKAVAPTLSGSLKQSTLNVAYSSGLNVKGTEPITWSIDGTLPDGLTFDTSTGVISGTPTSYGKNGSFKIKITASNSAGSKSKSITFKVKGTAPTFSGSLKQSTLNVAYSSGLTVKGSDPITLSIDGTLPDGLTFDTSTGVISGTPTSYGKNGSFKIKITASNPVGSRSKSITFKVKGTAPILSGSLKQSTLNVAYSSGLKVKGTDPITWSISGELPEGLTFNTSTGVISGTPTSYGKNGSFRIKITASNQVGSRSKSITFRVNGTKPTIKAKFPNATAGEYYSVNLTATGSDPITWTADLPEYLTLNGDTITGNIPDTVPGNRIKIKVYASNPVKTVNNTYTIKVITNKKAIPEKLNDDNDTGSTENESDNAIPTDNNAGEVQGVTGVTGDSTQTENQKSGVPESYIVVAELGEISRDVAGMYDFEVELPDPVSAGSELIYIANSETPSDDDKIAEFFDDTGKEITAVPESRKISVSVWLNAETIYRPEVAVRH